MTRDAPTIGITGATGVLGSAWLRHALTAHPEWRALALVRDPAGAERRFASWPAAWRDRIDWVRADLGRSALPARLRCVDTAWWHFAARTSLARDAATAADAMAVNTQGTLSLLEALREVGNAVPFYHLSTAYVAGRQTGRIREVVHRADGEFRNPYERSKAAAEVAVWRHLSETQRGAIFRPSVVVPADLTEAGPSLAALFTRAVLAAITAGDPEVRLSLPASARINLVTRDWVVRVLAMISSRDLPPAVYHVTAPVETELTSMAALLETIVPGLRVRLGAAADDGPTTASRLLARVWEDAGEYFATGAVFDRTQLERAVDPALASEPCDLAGLVVRQLQQGRLEQVRALAGDCASRP